MNEWLLLVAAIVVGSSVSLIGGIALLYGNIPLTKLQKYAVPFAAGALLAAAFADLLPEAIELSDGRTVMAYALGGFLGFFLLERLLHWFHHDHQAPESHAHGRQTKPLIIIGDTVHNAIDGLVIGAAFLSSPALGIVATIAVAAHEIPQEIGDFGLLRSLGMARKRVLLVNVLSALSALATASLVYATGTVYDGFQAYMLAIAGGFFIYIAAADIVPTINAEKNKSTANAQTATLLAAVIIVALVTVLAHGFVGGDAHEHPEEDHGHHDHALVE